MVRMRRRKIRLKTRSSVATAGKSWPTSAPTTMDTRIHVVSDSPAHGKHDGRGDDGPARRRKQTEVRSRHHAGAYQVYLVVLLPE